MFTIRSLRSNSKDDAGAVLRSVRTSLGILVELNWPSGTAGGDPGQAASADTAADEAANGAAAGEDADGAETLPLPPQPPCDVAAHTSVPRTSANPATAPLRTDISYSPFPFAGVRLLDHGSIVVGPDLIQAPLLGRCRDDLYRKRWNVSAQNHRKIVSLPPVDGPRPDRFRGHAGRTPARQSIR